VEQPAVVFRHLGANLVGLRWNQRHSRCRHLI
jgi:hypothetical protein